MKNLVELSQQELYAVYGGWSWRELRMGLLIGTVAGPIGVGSLMIAEPERCKNCGLERTIGTVISTLGVSIVYLAATYCVVKELKSLVSRSKKSKETKNI